MLPFPITLRPALAGAAVLLLLWMALSPLDASVRERHLTIPAGTAALLGGGGRDDGLPAAITLTLGVQDVLVLNNGDSVAQQFGPVQLAPGAAFRLPFEQAGVYPVAASAWAGRTLTVTVVEWPAPGWERFCWRLAALGQTLRYLPRIGPASAA